MDYIILPKYPQGDACIEESQLFNWLDENICNKKEYVEIDKICGLTRQEKTKIFESMVYLQMYTVLFPAGKMNISELPDYLGDPKFRNKNSLIM